MDFTGDIVISEYYADQTDVNYKVNGSWADVTNISINCTGSITFVGDVGLDSAGGNKRNVTWYAPKIYMNTNNGEYGIWLRNDENNSITYYNSSVNFDKAKYDTDPDYIGRIFFTGTSSLNITANSKGKTLIKASTLSGTITLDVEEGVQDGDTFLIQATDNQLVITDGEWTATPSTVGNITTYTLAKVAPVYKTRLIYEHLTDIPLNFTEVEYLESSGTQYIDTGYKPTNDTGIQIRHTICADNGNDNIIFGCRQDYADTRFWEDLDWGNDDSIGWGYGVYSNQDPTYSTYRYKLISSDIGKTVVSRLNYLNSRNCSINDNIRNLPQATLPTITRPIYIFAGNNQGNAGYFTNFKVYEVQISEGTTIVRDFVPCLDASNIPCLYDKVEGKAYYNAGTGSFTYGRKIIPVEYLESSGTQWINTGIFPANEMEFESKFTFTSLVSTNLTVIGSRDSTKRCQPIGAYNNKWSASIGGSYDANGSSVSANTSYVVKSIISNGQTITLTVNGNQASVCTSTTGLPNQELYIFGRNFYGNTDPVDSRINAKMYFMKIKAGNVLVRDYIPCKDENNVGYMFDRVTHTAYLNAGTGSFTYGKVMPKKKLRLIMDSKRRVPKGFKEVEYLQSSGTQYIDTGVIPTNTHGISINFSFSSNESFEGSWCPIGARTGDIRFWINKSVEESGLTFGFGDYTTSRQTQPKNTLLKASLNLYNNRKMIYVNGNYQENITSSISNLSNTLYLFGANVNGSVSFVPSDCRIYKVQISEGSVLVRDFIPCLDSNNVPCMWDAVERKAYYNVGTGSFTYGHTITPVEYLQSTGTQYIDTGYKFTSNMRFKINHTPTGSISDNYFTGHYATDNKVFLGGFYQNKCIWGIGKLQENTINASANQRFVVDMTYTSNSSTNTSSISGTINGQSVSLASTALQNFVYGLNILAFARNNNGSVGHYLSCKLYSFQIYNSDTLVRDFIPVKDENNVGYMLDKVSHTLYSNAGTGAFVVGGEYKDIVRFLKGE